MLVVKGWIAAANDQITIKCSGRFVDGPGGPENRHESMVRTECLQGYQGCGELHRRSRIELLIRGLRRDCCTIKRFRQNALNAGNRCQIGRLGPWGRARAILGGVWENATATARTFAEMIRTALRRNRDIVFEHRARAAHLQYNTPVGVPAP